jgi:hypothetical protein
LPNFSSFQNRQKQIFYTISSKRVDGLVPWDRSFSKILNVQCRLLVTYD